MTEPPNTANISTFSQFLLDQQRFMRMGQNFTMVDTGIAKNGNVKIGGLNNGDFGDLNNTYAAVAAETDVPEHKLIE